MPPKTNAAAAAGKPKLSAKRSRKIRTAVVESSNSSSAASSDTDSGTDSSTSAARTKKQKTNASTTTAARDVASPLPPSDSEPDAAAPPSAFVSAAAFPSWYLRTVTQELAEDLERVRGAPDFGDAALPLLVHALQQGEGVFSGAEKARVMAAAAGAGER